MNQPKTNLPPDFIEEMKQELLARKVKLEQQILGFAERDKRQEDNFNAEFPNFGDKEDENAAEVADFERNLSMEGTLEQSIEMVNRALKKIEQGTYGHCEKCDQLIARERLKIMPTATKCAPGQGCVINES